MGEIASGLISVVDVKAIDRLPARGAELMRFFARFEYALKEIGYGKSGKNGEVDVAWDSFANEGLGGAFLEKIRGSAVAPTILAKPPSKQVLQGTSLSWEKGTPPASVQELIGAVRRVRNNLVHGGKSGDEDSDRNDKLVAEAIGVLTEALRCHAELCYRFEGKY
jgi:hypothetical protein